MAQQEVLPKLEVVYASSTPPAYIDIVAVHGILEYDASEAWVAKNPLDLQHGVNWLTGPSMLPNCVPNIRVLQFTYKPPTSRDSLRHHINRTSQSLARFLTQQTLAIQSRAIIFVAHGYGGLIVLNALHRGEIGNRTIGVACFAVPFRVVQRCPALPGAPTSLSATTGRAPTTADTLSSLLQEFRSSPNGKRILVRCFYELDRSGEDGFIVPRKAATIEESNFGENTPGTFALKANHYNINKFRMPDDPNFELVCDVMQGFADRAYPDIIAQAILKGDDEQVKSMIDLHPTSIATNDKIGDALAAAVRKGRLNALRMLLAHGVNVNAFLNSDRDTALHLAVRSPNEDREEVVRFLLEKGSDVAIKNATGKSALNIAREMHLPAIEKLLEDRPLITGPLLRRYSSPEHRQLLDPKLTDDFGASLRFHARVADIYEVQGREKAFLRTPNVNALIYTQGPRHLMNRATSRWSGPGDRKFRWLHLPSNNLTWMKHLILRTYCERPTDGPRNEEDWYEKCHFILDRTYWELQVNVSPINNLAHIRYMKPQCRKLESLIRYSSEDLILFMPYLHYEKATPRQQMADTVKEVRKTNARRMPPKPDSLTPDQKLVWSYLWGDMPLHIRRTLDQFYYDALDSDTPQREGVEPRNKDQVVYRFMENEWKDEDPYVLMVDQLWMVMLEDDTLITSFPQRWNRTDNVDCNAVKEADIAGLIQKELSNENRAPLESTYDMMFLVLDVSTGLFYDRAVQRNEKLRFLEFFERRIQDVTNGDAESFGHLKQQLRALSLKNQARDKDSTLTQLLDELLDISEEVDLMNEIKDCHDELVMIKTVFAQQLDVLMQLKENITYRDPSRQSTPSRQGSSPKMISVIEKWNHLYDTVDARRIKIEEMDDSAWRTYKSLNNLFDLKQKQANVLEAHYSRKVAQDSGRNSVAFLIFTVVSIIFLPLTFVAQFYSMPVSSWPHNGRTGNIDLPLGYASSRVFGIGLAIAACVVGLAFTLNFFILESPWSRLQNFKARSGAAASVKDVERKEVLARTSPEKMDAISVISYHSYDAGKSPSRSSIAMWLQSWRGSSVGSDEKGENGTLEA